MSTRTHTAILCAALLLAGCDSIDARNRQNALAEKLCADRGHVGMLKIEEVYGKGHRYNVVCIDGMEIPLIEASKTEVER